MSEIQRALTAAADRFSAAWRRLAWLGECDQHGSAEFHRVFWEWTIMARPANVEAFIKERANKPAQNPTG